MDIGKAIKKLREEKDCNQMLYAEKIGISQSYLSQIERGHKKPSTELLETISNVSDIPLPIIFWLSVEECDITDNKKDVYKLLKNPIDSLIISLF